MFSFARPFYPLILQITRRNPEGGHKLLIESLKKIDQWSRITKSPLLFQGLDQSFSYPDTRLTQQCWGLTFPNPIGLAAGCDKDGEAPALWPHLGFGFAELGGVTFHAQQGNPKPRLFRLPDDQAFLNRLGGNNQGAKVVAERLQQTWTVYPRSTPVGINLIKSKITPLEAATEDYVQSFQALEKVADYFVVNVSSPNTPGLRSLQSSEELAKILAGLQAVNSNNKPLLVKIAPDLTWEEIDQILDLAKTYQLAGIVATNTTLQRDGLKTEILAATGQAIRIEAGGISGAPLRQRSTEIIRYLYRKTEGTLPIVGVGGIFSAEDAWEKIQAGASLLQLYTGWIYQGPWLIRDILQGLTQKLEEQGFEHIEQAVGSEEI
jgi:dihydroorotate dehydrogenase